MVPFAASVKQAGMRRDGRGWKARQKRKKKKKQKRKKKNRRTKGVEELPSHTQEPNHRK